MAKKDINSEYVKNNGRQYMDNLSKKFLAHFNKIGLQEQKPVEITSGIDKSVHLVGAAISALKHHIQDATIPDAGLMISQPCIRARNANKLLMEGFQFEWGAHFTNIETLAPYDNIDKMCEQTFSFFYDALGFSYDELVVRVSSNDPQLMSLCKKYCPEDKIEKDTFPDKYYTHTIGMPDYVGKNFNFALKHPEHDQYKDVGNFIVFTNTHDNKPAFIEVGFGDTVILKEMYGLDHILDAFPVPKLEIDDNGQRKIAEDCIITSMALSREGLVPSSKNAMTKILNKYIRALHHYTSKNDITTTSLLSIMTEYERNQYGSLNGASERIVDFIADKKQHIENLNAEAYKMVNHPALKS